MNLPEVLKRIFRPGSKPGLVAGGIGLLVTGMVLVQQGNSRAAGSETGESGEESRRAGVGRVMPVEAVVVEAVTGYPVPRSYVGVVEAARGSRPGFEQGGTIEEILVDEGDAVEKGALLARLDTRLLEAESRQREAALSEAKAAMALIESRWERVERLAPDGAVSEQERDDLMNQLEAARAAVVRAGAALDRVRVDLEKSSVRAPFSGTVVRRFSDEGDTALPGQPVLVILESGNLEVRIGVPVSRVHGVVPGAEVQLTRMRDGDAFSGHVHRTIARLDPAARTVEVILRIDQPAGLISGELVEWSWPEMVNESGFRIPASALTGSVRGLWTVHALVESESGFDLPQLQSRELEVLHVSGDEVIVRGALKAGERIVASGVNRVAPGQHVEVVDRQ